MSITLYGRDEETRMTPAPDDNAPALSRKLVSDTPLARDLTETQESWLLQYLCELWTRLDSGMTTWRSKMSKWERMSEMDYSDRVGRADPNNESAMPDVFSFQNDTLGMSEGFVDFAAAQAKNDIFGTRPWLAATPEGKNDIELSEKITKHAQWKLNRSDFEAACVDAIRIACWGGTVFLKSRWSRDVETFKRSISVAYSINSGEAFLNEAGVEITSPDELEAMGVDGSDVEWRNSSVEESVTVYDNSRTACLDFNDIAFDSKAQDLDLMFTPVFTRFRMGLLDVVALYNIAEEDILELRHSLANASEEVRANRGEGVTNDQSDENEANPSVSLIEGFIRCDPLRTGRPIRIHCVFSPSLNRLFHLDYLANQTPGGHLPVFPIRIGKIPRRIFGIGYFEKYENANNAVDRQLNSITYRNQLSANVLTAYQPDALDDREDTKLKFNAREPVRLAPDKKIEDLFQSAVIPDNEHRSVELLNMHMQMPQMRSGITSAAQGELKGVPNASTATGVNQLTSRGALLIKDPISQLTMDIQKATEFCVHLLYANQDRNETFTWGEGESAELLTITANDVQGLQMNVSLTLVQSQAQDKLNSAQAAIGIITSYVSLPETEKVAARPIFVQAVTALGYNNADDIIRQAAVDPIGILAIVPPELAPIIEDALVAAGVLSPEVPPTGENSPASAPVTEGG